MLQTERELSDAELRRVCDALAMAPSPATNTLTVLGYGPSRTSRSGHGSNICVRQVKLIDGERKCCYL